MPEYGKPVAGQADDLQRNAAAREALLKNLQAMRTASIRTSNSESVRLRERIEYGNRYFRGIYDLPNRIREGDYRDRDGYEAVKMHQALLTANDPKYSFEPVEPYDAPISKDISTVDAFLWDQKQLALRWSMAVLDCLRTPVGYIMPRITKGKSGLYELQYINPSPADILVEDWTQWDVAKQGYIIHSFLMSIKAIEAEWPQLKGKLNAELEKDSSSPQSALGQDYFKIAGGDGVVSKNEHAHIQAMLSAGKAMVHEYWLPVGDKFHIAYEINGNLAEHRTGTDYEDFALIALRNDMEPDRFLGTSDIDVSKGNTDIVTQLTHSLMRNDAMVTAPPFEFDESTGYDAADYQNAYRGGNKAIGLSHDQYEAGPRSRQVKIIPQHENKFRLIEYFRQRNQRVLDNSDWLNGSVGSGPDPAVKVDLMQKAGLHRIKQRAKMLDYDALFRLGNFQKWFIQRKMTAKQIIRITGDTNPDGSPKFFEFNIPVAGGIEELNQLIGKAEQSENGTVRPDDSITDFTAQELKAYKELFLKRVSKEGGVAKLMLRDMSVGKFDVITKNSDTLPYNKMQRMHLVMYLQKIGETAPGEPREEMGLSMSPEIIEKLRANANIVPIEQIAMRLAQVMGAQDEQQAQQVIENPVVTELLEYIQSLQKKISV